MKLSHMEAPNNILVVDDNPNNLQILHRILNQAGYKVRPALSGELALRAIESSVPDLILLDVRMEGLDGYQFCQILQANPKTAGIPIIFISALQDVQDKLKAFQAGGVDYVSKPFQAEEVLARVSTHLKIYHLQKCLAYQNEHLNELVETKAKELAALERESTQRLDQITQLNRSMTSSVFSSAIAHDLRQPLAAIMSNAEAADLILQQDSSNTADVHEILTDIMRDTQRASQIIRAMRSMLNKGKSEILRHDLNEIVRDVVRVLGAEFRQRRIDFELQLANDELWVNVDLIQIQQVLVNLLINSMDALKEMPEGQRRITLSTQLSQIYAEVFVQDSGSGFGENLNHVFESFFTTKSEGMGMGLPICATLIHTHQGQMNLHDIPEGGAVVSFKLPLNN